MDMSDITLIDNGMSIDVYGAEDTDGNMPFLGYIDLLARTFVPENGHRTIAFTDTQLADATTIRRTLAASI